MNQLEQLKKMTTVVADTGDFESIKNYTPTDSTTNPSLILKASQDKKYFYLIEKAIEEAQKKSLTEKALIEETIDQLLFNFGKEILNIIPGRVSIEVDARYSYDTEKSIQKAKKIISLFEGNGFSRDRILIKLAATWEGIEAAKELEKENIHCNMTLIFSFCQAIASAQAKVTLISPFVGRILDWYKRNHNVESYKPLEDPGVISVTKIYNYYKKYDYKTEIMGASFRNIDQILSLAGCDLLTISINLLEHLQNSKNKITRFLNPDNAKNSISIDDKINITKDIFYGLLQADKMASEKLSEGISLFTEDIKKLELFIEKHINFSMKM